MTRVVQPLGDTRIKIDEKQDHLSAAVAGRPAREHFIALIGPERRRVGCRHQSRSDLRNELDL
jgi:hypothetical protein